MVAPYAGPTRTEADFLAHVQAVVATDPTATRWHFVMDNLNTHQSESLVRWVAAESDLDHRLGRERQVWHPPLTAKPGCLPRRSHSSYRLSLHAQALLLAQSDRDLAQHSCAQTAQTWFIPFP